MTFRRRQGLSRPMLRLIRYHYTGTLGEPAKELRAPQCSTSTPAGSPNGLGRRRRAQILAWCR